jgi:hypothetical protein
MNVVITTQNPISVKITTQNPEVLEVLPAVGINVSVAFIKDGRDGKSAYQIWVDEGNVGTEDDFLESLKGNDGLPGQDATNNTLEMVRAENPVIEGDIDANGNTIQNLRNPVAAQEPATKVIVDAALQAAKDYADTVSAETVRFAGFWDASSGTYPTGGTIRRGDQYEISVAGTIAGIEFEIGDLLRSRINSPGQTTGNWSASQGNVQQATESIQGTAKVISSTEASNENTTNDKDFVTGKKLWLNFVTRFLQLPWTWAAKQIFTTAPRLSSTTAGQYLKVDAQKEVVSVSSIPVADVAESVAKRFTNDVEMASKANLTSLLSYERFAIVDVQDRIVTGVTEQAHQFYLIAANTYRVGSKLQLDWEMIKTIVGSNTQFSRLKHHTSMVPNAGTVIAQINASLTTREIRMKAELVIRPGNIANILLQDTSVAGIGTSNSLAGSFPFDPTVDNYFFVTTSPNNALDSFNQIYFGLKGVY